MPKAISFHLSEEELIVISEAINYDKRPEVRQRAIGLRLLHDGQSPKEVAVLMSVSQPTVYSWYHRWQTNRLEGLANQPKSGRPLLFPDDRLDELRDLLEQGAMIHGWQNELWTAKRVAELIRKHFNIKISIGRVRIILKSRLSWSVQRPTQVESKRDEKYILKWKEHYFPQIVKDTRARGAYLVFIDESGFMASPTRRQTYSPRGKTPVIKVTDPHGRISTIGAITVSPKYRRLNFFYHLLPNNVNFRGVTVVLFLDKIFRRIRNPMTILWDGVSIHSSKPVKKYLEQHSEILIEPLPAYAHELNPVDKVWLYLKYDCLANYAPLNLDELRDRLKSELYSLPRKSNVLKWCIKETGLKTRVTENPVSI